jgi:N4-gp56 family major capsid protein
MAETWVDQGAYLSNQALSMDFQVTAQPMMKFRQFCDVKSALGKNAGESEAWLKVSNLGTPGGTLTETNTMHVSSQAKVWDSVTVTEYGNSLPFTFKVTELSKFDLKKIIDEGLKNDMVKVLDGLVEREFNKTPLRYVGLSASTSTITTNSAAAANNSSVLNTYHVRKMILELKKRNIPGYGSLGGDYAMICSVEAMENMLGALEDKYQYTDSGFKKAVAGEVGRYFGCRFIEDSEASRFIYDPLARTRTAKTWTNALSLDAYMFGAQTCKEAVTCAEEIRAKEITDYGRSHGLAWYFLGGFKLMWTGESDARIIKWDSAA